MKVQIFVLAALLSVLGNQAMAGADGADRAQIETTKRENEQKAIAELLDKGVIEWNEGHFTVKDPDALETLRKQGRVDLTAAAEHVVCY